MTVIAVDDEKGALYITASAIRRAEPNAELWEFLRPSDALAFAETHVVDVAFLDIKMPEMTGVELARRLKILNPKINIIFATAYSQYGLDAMKMHASGYLLKPLRVESVKRELEELRYGPPPLLGIRAVTFGQFDLLKDGVPVRFPRSKAKELLAYLIDRNGGGVNKKELYGILFEDRPYDSAGKDYMSKIIRSLTDALKAANVEEVLIRRHNYYAVDKSRFSCDLYEYYDGLPRAINAFHGEYMAQYGWGEFTLSELMGKIGWKA